MCGSPVYDYEHIFGWQATGHDPDAMTLLCPEHHREKTAGRLPIELVEQHNAHPFSAGREFTKGHPLYFTPGSAPQLMLGNLGFRAPTTNSTIGVSVDNCFALGVGISSTGQPVIDIDVRDLNDRSILRVAHGELRAATRNWDVRFEGTRLRVQQSARRTAIDLRFDAPNGTIEVVRGDFSLHHARILIGTAAPSGGFELPDSSNGISNMTLEGGGISIGNSPSAPALARMKTARAFGAPPVPSGSAFRIAEQ